MNKVLTGSMLSLTVVIYSVFATGAKAATNPPMPPGFEPIAPINVELPKPIEPSSTPLSSASDIESSKSKVDTNNAVQQNQQLNDQRLRERESQVDAKLQEIDAKLKQLETRSIGPQATPLQIQVNQPLIGELQFKAQELLDKFEFNNKFIEKINKEPNLTADLLQAYKNIPAEQESIVKLLLELEGKIRSFDPGVIFPQLEAKSLIEISQLPGYKKLSLNTLKTLRMELDNIKVQYTALPTNQYRLQSPFKEDADQFKKNWKIGMSDAKLPVATEKFHQQFINEHKAVNEKLQAIKTSLSQASSLGIDTQLLDSEVLQIEQVEAFSKTSPEQLSQALSLTYTGNNKIELDKTMEIFYKNTAIGTTVVAALGLILFLIYLRRNRTESSEIEPTEETKE
jgi:hypothetical protein